jgi:ribosomal protein L14E/L6E/L27E
VRISAPSRRARGKLAQVVAEQNKRPDDPALAAEVEDRRREYRYLSAADYIKQLVDDAPRLSEAQRSALALLLRGGA